MIKTKKAKKNKLSIAQLHWGFPPIIGGVETHLSTMLPEMVRRGHEVNLLTASCEGEKVTDNYKEAKEGTIRRDYATDIEKNVVHGSDSPETAKFEIGYFFNSLEISRN